MPVGFQEHRAFIGKNNVQPQNPKKRSVAIAQEQGDNLGELLGVLVDLYSENQQAGNQANGSNFNKKTVATVLTKKSNKLKDS